ncbi:hypothetical protein OEZ85_006301 [Tetradesmus obliquus]|uniref:S-adenosyl-L-methionine-dependent methyltransferase n=1 Tax=Tetradesmus obliquus TaxID=3088 RepID=A0ABY8TWK3_TETOB|nr:hypothetical protein OEZ85_006301 [Tetradesmus obliquus]
MQEDLEDRVNRTCRGVAAFRAVELLYNPAPIVRDELSVQLAGPQYIDVIKKRWEEAVQRSGCDPAAPHHLLFAARARIIDDMVIQELQQLVAHSAAAAAQPEAAHHPTARCSSPRKENHHHQQQQQQQQQKGDVCLQVVSVGCGVDTRPWRLALPSCVAWFDVDQQPVISLKHKLLAEAGAQQQQQQEVRFPLKCSSYTALAADATSSSWLADLAAAGFNQTLPTVWVLEGLLYYLTPEQGAVLFADIAAAGSPGKCVVLASHIPACNLEANRSCPAGHSLAGLFKSWVGDLVGSDGQLLQHDATASLQQQQQLRAAELQSSSTAIGSSSSSRVSRWGPAEVSADLAVLLRECYNAEALYPYGLDYSGGKQLPEVECVVTVRLEA